jgi:putative transposase
VARLPRLAIGGEVHLVVMEGHNRQRVFGDDEDRARFVATLRDAQARQRVAVHAYAMLPGRVWLLLTPPDATSLGRMIQAIGRGYTTAFNRRHGRSGTLWDGRFGSTVVEAGPSALAAMLFVEQAPVREGDTPQAQEHAWSTARHHLGVQRDPMISELAAYWALGNTPFDRVAAYAGMLDEPLASERVATIAGAARRGWALGSVAYVHRLQQRTSRRLQARRPGRPAGGRAAGRVPSTSG